MKKHIFLILLSSLVNTALAQDTFVPDLYVYDLSWVNPAFVANNYHNTFSFNGRASLSENYQPLSGSKLNNGTYQVSYEAYVSKISSGIGVRATSENLGAWSSHQLSGLYNYQYNIGQGKISAGLGVARLTGVLDYNAYLWIDPADPLRRTGSAEYKSWRTDVGIAYQNEKITVGVAVQDAFSTASKSEQDTLQFHHTPVVRSYASYAVSLSEYLSLHPSVLYVASDGRRDIDASIHLSVNQKGMIGLSHNGFQNSFSEWRFHGGFKLIKTIECLFLYVPEGRYVYSRGELIVRLTLGKKTH
jgi:type IX secretion system PorP/SprF family membrane protein